MRVDATGLMRLGAGNENAFLRSIDNVNEHIRVGLLMRGQAPVALDVGHGAADDVVVGVGHLDEGL